MSAVLKSLNARIVKTPNALWAALLVVAVLVLVFADEVTASPLCWWLEGIAGVALFLCAHVWWERSDEAIHESHKFAFWQGGSLAVVGLALFIVGAPEPFWEWIAGASHFMAPIYDQLPTTVAFVSGVLCPFAATGILYLAFWFACWRNKG